MTSVDEFFGKYLNVKDIKEEKEYAILQVKSEKIGEEQKPRAVVYFEGLEKGLTLNMTNADLISNLAGSREIESWVGLKLILYVDPTVKYLGKITGGIRIKAPAVPSKEVTPQAQT